MRMRKSVLVSALFAALAAFSCMREDPAPYSTVHILEASLPSAPETRTTLGPRSGAIFPVLWSAGDFITVNGVPSARLTAAEAGGSSARFTFPEGVSAPFKVEYGSGIPSVQPFADGNIRSGSAPMSATSTGTSFMMEHLGAIVSFTLSGPVTVSGLSLRSLDGSLPGEALPVQMTVPSGGVRLDGGKTFCFVVPPCQPEKGLALDIYTTDGARMILTAFAGERIRAGKLYTVPPVAFAANAEPIIPIASYADLKAFADRVRTGEKALQARLTADIAVDGYWTPLDGFTGDLDGGGYTISGLRRALVQELTGCIRNLTVEGNVTISGMDDIAGDEGKYWAGILANRLYTGALVDHCTAKGTIQYNQWGKAAAVGGIAGYASRGSIRSSVNEASVRVDGDGSNYIHAGGIIGYIYTSVDPVTLEGCLNTGSITVRGRIKSAHLGGIVGNMGAVHTGLLSGNENRGEVAVSPTATLGGVLNLGGIAGSSQNVLTACSHTGTLRQGAPSAFIQNIGGIAGSVVTEKVSGCVNEGTILLDGASASATVRCGGILGFAAGDTSVDGITLEGCAFRGGIAVRIPSHATVYAKPFTGLYSITGFSETSCSDTGKIEVK